MRGRVGEAGVRLDRYVMLVTIKVCGGHSQKEIAHEQDERVDGAGCAGVRGGEHERAW